MMLRASLNTVLLVSGQPRDYTWYFWAYSTYYLVEEPGLEGNMMLIAARRFYVEKKQKVGYPTHLGEAGFSVMRDVR